MRSPVSVRAMLDMSAETTDFLDRLDTFAHEHGWIDGEWCRTDPTTCIPLHETDPLHIAVTRMLPLLNRFSRELRQAANLAEMDELRARKGMIAGRVS